MKKNYVILFLLFSFNLFSQKKVQQQFYTPLNDIQISTNGLDDFVIENTTSTFIEVVLFAENPKKQHIVYVDDERVASIEFKFDNNLETEDGVFRKFITKRLERASAVIKVPKGKNVTIFGENINISTDNFKNELSIFIEKGIVKLNHIQNNTTVNLYAGLVSASVKNTDIKVTSNIGTIQIDDQLFHKKYENNADSNQKKLTINSIKANVFLKTE